MDNPDAIFQNTAGFATFDPVEGIATFTLKMAGKVNKINADFGEGLTDAITRFKAMPGLRGIILATGHKDFCVGADLDMLFPERNPAAILAICQALAGVYRGLETLGVPVVAALTGSALGGGCELALACHRRVALADPGVQIGLPEVSLGVIPGAGGTQRLPRLIGAQPALEILAQGQVLRPDKALAVGLVHELQPSAEAVHGAAAAWIGANRGYKQPWDRPGFAYPGGAPDSEEGRSLFVAACAMLYKKTAGAFPAAEAVVRLVQEGSRLVFDRAMELEARAFAHLATSDQAKDMIRTFWFHKNAADRHEGLPRTANPRIQRVGILGAGMMGSGLAFVAAQRGYEVVLKDIRPDVLDKAMSHCGEQAVRRLKHLGAEGQRAVLARIRPTLFAADLAACDLVIEAVIEDLRVKRSVIAESEAYMADSGVFASNTSALPIGDLAAASVRPAQMLGLHFFSPVEQMPLVEVVRGAATSDETLARALAFVASIKKTPIVVSDGYGFYTTRVFMAYVNEGANLVAEGHNPAVIEWGARTAGMIVPPLQVSDEVSLSLGRHVVAEASRYLGADRLDQPGVAALLSMVDLYDRPGKSAGRGFYVYEDGRRRGLWPGLSQLAHGTPAQTGVAVVERRLLLAQALEAARCLESGVLRGPGDGDVGAILGVGFAPNTGGPFAWLNRQDLIALVAECEALALVHGARYAPPTLLRAMAAEGRRFYAA